MIISTNGKPSIEEFKLLVDNATDRLNKDAGRRMDYYLTRNGQKLEKDVKEALESVAVGTPFNDEIKIISGQKFPDIVAKKYYGVEVKSSKDDKWTTIGGSVNESTRKEDVERIFLTFGKLQAPVEFRSRPYEDCLSDVAVTHYPRYKIDMNLSVGETIFDRMNTTYDDLRNTSDPVGNIVSYYKSQLGAGERLWWMGGENATNVDEMKMRLANTLATAEREALTVYGMALFPELIGNSNRRTKYEQFVLWLAAERQVVSPSARDFFSAGGQETIITKNRVFEKVPQVIYKIYKFSELIEQIIYDTEEKELCRTWKVDKIRDDRITQWIERIISHVIDDYCSQALIAIFFDR